MASVTKEKRKNGVAGLSLRLKRKLERVKDLTDEHNEAEGSWKREVEDALEEITFAISFLIAEKERGLEKGIGNADHSVAARLDKAAENGMSARRLPDVPAPPSEKVSASPPLEVLPDRASGARAAASS